MPSLAFLKFAALWIASTAGAWLLQHWGVIPVAVGLVVFILKSASID